MSRCAIRTAVRFAPTQVIEQLFNEKLGASDRFGLKDVMKAVPRFLPEEDLVVTLAAGYLRSKIGLFVLTNNRVLFLRGTFRITQELDLPYESVTSVVESASGQLTVTSVDDELIFGIKNPAEVLTSIREGMPPPGSAPQQKVIPAPIQVPDDGGPHAAVIDRLYRGLRRLDRWSVEKGVKFLPGYLSDEDELLALASVLRDKKPGLLALTDSRLLFIPSDEPEKRSRSIELRYDSLTSAGEADASALQLVTAEGDLTFYVGKGEKRRELLDALHERMRATGAPST